MAKEDLEEIKEHLEDAGRSQRIAKKIAERVGDKEGAARIKQAEEKTEEVLKSFPNNDQM